MKLQVMDREHLLPGTRLEGDVLVLPAEGGGLLLPELKGQGGRWLNLDMEVRCDHAQAFELRLYGEEEAPRVIIRFGLMPAFRAAVALDMAWADGHILFPGHEAGMQKIVCHGSRIDREEIRKAELISMPGTAPVCVRIGRAALEDQPRKAASLSDRKWIDRFGQYLGKDWPGKIQSEEEIISALRTEAELPNRYPDGRWNAWGGWAGRKMAEGTGFFTRIKKDGRWYLVDPSGCAFFSTGPDCTVIRCDARIDGLEELLEDLPAADAAHAACYGEMNRTFGENARVGKLFSYERLNLQRAFGRRAEEIWPEMITAQLKNMGMNTLGNWSDPALYGKMPYVTSLPAFPDTEKHIFRDFPDVLSDEYRLRAEECARTLAERKDDPWMIGYFLRNEPAWAFVDNLIITDEVLRNPEPSACREALIAWLRDQYQRPEALSEAWNYPIRSFDDLREPIESASARSARAREDLRTFSARLNEAYIRIPAEACRRVDPHHMILGMRWAWISDPLLVSGWSCFDVFSINCYAVDPMPALDRVRELGVDLPIMIGEFHFGALDAGLPATGLEGVTSQAERGKAYRFYCERVAAHPQGVGCHWFQCYDQFALGRFDGENYNIGLFDITLRPYPEMKKAALATAERLDAIHAGQAAPTEERPDSIPMIAY